MLFLKYSNISISSYLQVSDFELDLSLPEVGRAVSWVHFPEPWGALMSVCHVKAAELVNYAVRSGQGKASETFPHGIFSVISVLKLFGFTVPCVKW